MRALLVAVGTRGDVQPALAVALELRRLGHDVRMCVSPNFVDWASSLGLDSVPMGVEMRMPSRGTGATPTLTPEELRRLRESMPDLITDQFETIGRAAIGCDVILGCNAHQYAAPSVAERLGIGCVTAVYAPVSLPSPDLAPPPMPGMSASPPSTVTGASVALPAIDDQWRQTAEAWNARARNRINQNRERLGLGPVDDVLEYVLTNHTWLATDAALSPVPTTPGRDVFQTGAWVLADDEPLPADLEAFLHNGAAPVLVGFGSMPASADTTRAAVDTVRALGHRVIVGKGWADLDVIEGYVDCITIGDVSYSRLLPRVAAFVHHGGAGTTAAAARAGIPQLITPLFSDQFYWATRIVDLGVGSTVPHASATAPSLGDALLKALEPAVASRARRLARDVSRDGATVAARRLVRDYGA